VRWRLTQVTGRLGSLSSAEALARASAVVDEQGQCRIEPKLELPRHELLWARLEPLLATEKPNWVILPHTERQRHDWWQARLGQTAEVGFGRAAVALALSQLNRLAVPGRIAAAHIPADGHPGVEGVLALDWTPADYGLAFDLSHMDGRLDGKTDMGALLELGRTKAAQPEVLICPGTGGDNYLERLLPFLAHLGPWAGPEVRWEFAEAALGRLGVVGSLYNWAWLEAGYRLGDWAGPSAVLELDESPLAGLSVVNWTVDERNPSADGS
jgi:hypothetical protein